MWNSIKALKGMMKSKKKTTTKSITKTATGAQPVKKTEKKAVPEKAKKPALSAAPRQEKDAGQKLSAKGKKTPTSDKKSKTKPETDELDHDLGDEMDMEVDADAQLAVEEEIGDDDVELDDDDTDLDTDDDDGADDSLKAEAETAEEVVLTDAEGNRYCHARDCDQIAVVEAYCRYHYLLFWKKIQVRKKILMDGKLERYVEELTSRYPDKFLEMIRRDLRTEKDFLSAIQELEIDESAIDTEFEEDAQSFLDEVRGMGGGEGDTVEDEF